MPVSFAFSSLDLHFWRKPSKRQTDSGASTTTAAPRASTAADSASVFVSKQRTPAGANQTQLSQAHRTQSLRQESYFWCHQSACACQQCCKRTDTDSYVRQSSSQEYRDGGLRSSVDRYGNSVPRQQRINAPLLAENGPTQTTFICQPSSSTEPLERRQVQQYHYRSETRIDPEEVEKREQLEHWLLQQPLSARKLDQSDRHVAMLSVHLSIGVMNMQQNIASFHKVDSIIISQRYMCLCIENEAAVVPGMEERSDSSSFWRMSQSRMSSRMTSTPTSTSTSYSFSFVTHEASMVSPLDWFSSHSRHVTKGPVWTLETGGYVSSDMRASIGDWECSFNIYNGGRLWSIWRLHDC
ncbi:hypothetical protein Q1695_008946 [Nippostrongylus brasiliensis]|nr:hypothetical protein Q1695_008946 [Nippostrongylus brasiliensis]